MAATAAAAAAIGPACATRRPAVSPAPLAEGRSPTMAILSGDWDDLEPAMEVAVRRSELAIVERELGEDRAVFTLQSVANEPGRLIAMPGRSADGSPMIQVEARVGLFGNPARERALLDALAARLGQLLGREWAPIR